MTRARAAAVAVLLAALASCAYAGGRTTPYRPPVAAGPEHADAGKELYMRDCAWCHGRAGEGTRVGPDLVTGTNGPALTRFVLATGRMPLDVPDERVSRAEPLYDDAQVDAIVEFVEGFGQPGPDVPDVDVAAGDLGHGAELYQEHCAACHSTTGIGGALASGSAGELPDVHAERAANIAPGLHASSPEEVAEAIVTGPGTMPVFGAETLSQHDLESIVRYVEYLQHPDDRGGAPMGGVGPVAEGAIGWIVGLGVLLLIVRWLGTKAGAT